MNASARTPNILLLMTDQQRADTIGALGNPIIRTPQLDRLVREGVAFERCYSPAPVCVPARFAMMTGLPPHLTGCVDNMEQPAGYPSFMQMLAEQGYQTHGVGKMHFSNDRHGEVRWGFESRDFSEEIESEDDFHASLVNRGYGHVLDPHGVRSEYYYLPQPSQLPAELHHTSWVADRSAAFLQRRDPRRPFFLMASFIKPHPPFENPWPWNRLYRSADMPDPFVPENSEAHLTFWNRLQNRYKYMDGGLNPHLLRTQRVAYYASISFIDQQIGRILESLGAEMDNTLIVFTSDHGEMLGDFGCFGKRCMLEASARIPLVIRHPAHFAAGARCTVPVSLLDIFPTFAAAAGSSQRPSREGGDLAEIAKGNVPSRECVFSQFSQRSLGLYLAAETDWKYIYSAADQKEWLFNLREDPQEAHNLANHPGAAGCLARLRERLLARFAADGYEWAVDQGRWRDYGRSVFPTEPDREGLIFQDPSDLNVALAHLTGYAPSGRPDAENALGATGPERMDARTGSTRFSL